MKGNWRMLALLNEAPVALTWSKMRGVYLIDEYLVVDSGSRATAVPSCSCFGCDSLNQCVVESSDDNIVATATLAYGSETLLTHGTATIHVAGRRIQADLIQRSLMGTSGILGIGQGSFVSSGSFPASCDQFAWSLTLPRIDLPGKVAARCGPYTLIADTGCTDNFTDVALQYSEVETINTQTLASVYKRNFIVLGCQALKEKIIGIKWDVKCLTIYSRQAPSLLPVNASTIIKAGDSISCSIPIDGNPDDRYFSEIVVTAVLTPTLIVSCGHCVPVGATLPVGTVLYTSGFATVTEHLESCIIRLHEPVGAMSFLDVSSKFAVGDKLLFNGTVVRLVENNDIKLPKSPDTAFALQCKKKCPLPGDSGSPYWKNGRVCAMHLGTVAGTPIAVPIATVIRNCAQYIPDIDKLLVHSIA